MAQLLTQVSLWSHYAFSAFEQGVHWKRRQNIAQGLLQQEGASDYIDLDQELFKLAACSRQREG